MSSDSTLTMNEGSWNKYADVLYVDQPAGTGFSFVEQNNYAKDMKQVVDQFLVFLEKFFQVFPQLEANDMYIAGESFAGVYIPYIASEILHRNEIGGPTSYRLKGIAIGNGWIDPWNQYLAYFDFAVEKNLLDGLAKDRAEQQLFQCKEEQRKNGVRIHTEVCENILQSILDHSVFKLEDGTMMCVNEYDIRLKDEYPKCGLKWPYELENITAYLQKPEVIKALHADGKPTGWRECSGIVGGALDDDRSLPPVRLLPNILSKIPVLLYSGDQDLICNHRGTEYLIDNLTWNGATGLGPVPTLNWYIRDQLVGYYQMSRNLTYVLIKDGSHMVPYDKPIELLDMINRFIGVNETVVPSRLGDEQTPGAGSLIDEEKWEKYYNTGTIALIVLVAGLAIAGYLWYRSRKQARFSALKVGDNEDTNELDQLVVESPAIFSADEQLDSDEELEEEDHRDIRK
ncbi:uncharacterized protein VTP21DRAFT_7027 [Calcarisporiella thermophila]|uniref:uncharacterized protein n=1 Tax=Calcarisporiella thermophila TaxID=911321 RepID=UPI0037448A1B